MTYATYILVSEPVTRRRLTDVDGSQPRPLALLGDLRPGDVSAAGWGWLAGIAVVCSVASISLFFAGLRRAGATAASILATLEPLVTVGARGAHLRRAAQRPAARRRRGDARRRPRPHGAVRATSTTQPQRGGTMPAVSSGPLNGKVALVAGATRGAGRGIAVALGEAGATVYCTGRSTRAQRSEYDRPETIEETAELVDAAGGTGIAVAVDHLEREQVAALVARIDADHGRLDVLVNDIWGGEKLFEWNTPVWEHDLDAGLRMLRLALDTHLITSHFALPLLIRRPGGLVVEMTDGTAEYNAANYRNSAFYDVVKSAIIRLAFAQSHELEPHGCAAVALTPGWMRSEMMLEAFEVTEETWREGTVGPPALPGDLREHALRRAGRRRARRRS